MSNEDLKKAFQALHSKITRDINPDSAIDVLYANDIISANDNNCLWDIQDSKNRCRKFLSILHLSSHHEAFVHLRDALRDEYPAIVDEIDKKPSPETASQLQQLHLDESIDGKFYYQ